ncbi:MAG: F0F1 ATP synthase subunit epsilon [Candidatus Bipolaricaulota bacterium]
MLRCELRSPDRLLFDGEAREVSARSGRGPFTILPQHAALVVALEPGLVRIGTPDGVRRFACIGGTLVVDEDRVQISSPEAVPVEEIDLQAVRAQASDASGPPEERQRIAVRLAALERAVEGRV